MSNAELVKRWIVLKGQYDYALPNEITVAIEDTIDHLSAQDDVRDRALEEAARECESVGGDNAQYHAGYIRALKSKPAAPVVECEHILIDDADPESGTIYRCTKRCP